MSTNFGSKDGILIRTMTLEDYKQIEGRIYNGEPILVSHGEDTKDMSQQFGEERITVYHTRLIEQGTCLVAIDENDGRIVGHVLAGCQTYSDLERQQQMATLLNDCNLKRVITFLTEVEMNANLYKHYGVSKLLYSLITQVDDSMRGKGIGSRLAAALMEVGRSKDFPLMAASCSSFYSGTQKMALGMECVYSMAYEDYKDENGKVVFKPAAPHTHQRVVAIKL